MFVGSTVAFTYYVGLERKEDRAHERRALSSCIKRSEPWRALLSRGERGLNDFLHLLFCRTFIYND